MPLLPPQTHADARVLLATRAVRGFVDGLISVVIAVLLPLLGFSALQVGVTVTAMMLGSATVTLLASTMNGRAPSANTGCSPGYAANRILAVGVPD